MSRNLWFGMLVVVLVCALCTTGCRRKSKTSATGDNIGGIAGSGQGTEQSLSSRPEGGMDVRSEKFESALFDYDSAQVKESERAKIEAVADFLKKNAKTGALVEGNCDERGSAEYNMSLGERRALAVRAYLVGLGIDGAIIQTKSNGKEKPVAMGHDEAAWSLNRRAEFVLFNQ
ncbi:MAG: OmpA family protein [Kiritimatiellaeota bacterium]|nr:OmpA family protein [Kiritimatiellota bacterium]